MDAQDIAVSQTRPESLLIMPGATGYRVASGVWRGVFPLATLVLAAALLASPRPTAAWQPWWAFGPGAFVGYPGGSAPWGLFPGSGPIPGTRFSFPPGAPLSYSEPGAGTTYCWSQSKGYYYLCGYSPSAPYPVGAVPPMLPDAAFPYGNQAAPPASGVFLFTLPSGAEATVDGVPIGLSEGRGIHAVTPGQHRVVLQVSGEKTEHTVNVPPHRIFTITPTMVVPTEP
jgi:hypothetical protein